MIELQHLHKIYHSKNLDFPALKDMNLSIKAGESVAIMGKSGSGKSTLLNILGCLDTYDKGEYHLNGELIGGLPDSKLAAIRNRHMGFVMQDFALIEQKTVLFNTMLPLYFDKTPRKQMKSLALRALKITGIEDQGKKKVNQLSGGQKQRVAIARAIVKQPAFLLADEPTGALDSATGKAIMETLQAMNQRGITLIVVTHDRDIASYCQRKITLADGVIVEDTASA